VNPPDDATPAPQLIVVPFGVPHVTRVKVPAEKVGAVPLLQLTLVIVNEYVDAPVTSKIQVCPAMRFVIVIVVFAARVHAAYPPLDTEKLTAPLHVNGCVPRGASVMVMDACAGSGRPHSKRKRKRSFFTLYLQL
jgi:hypothetical protein